MEIMLLRDQVKRNGIKGPTLLGFLETIEIKSVLREYDFRFPVQWVNRPNSNFRGFSGTVAAGRIEIGQKIRALPSGQETTVKEIFLSSKRLNAAINGQAVTITLDKEIDLSRGDVIVTAHKPCEVSDFLEADLVWMDQEPGYVGRSYSIQLGTSATNASLTDIKFKYDINSFEHLSCKELQLNEVSYCSNDIRYTATF